MKWTTIFLFFYSSSFGQCPDIDKLDLGGTYLSRTHNYIPFDPNISDTIQYCCDLKKIKKFADPILDKAKNYIVIRAGKEFYDKTEMESIEVNYPKSINIKYENLALYDLSNYDVKYWILYTYKKGNFKYAFGLLFDKEGTFISENMFPDVNKNLGFENYTNPCDVLNLVKNHKLFKNKQIDFIELAYLDEANSFCWLVKEKKIGTQLGFSKYKLVSLYINANSNKIEKIKEEEETSIACEIFSSKPKKKKN